MKRSIFTLLSLIVLLVALSSVAQAKSFHANRPLTTPYCYGDGLPHNNPPIQACDNLPHDSCGGLIQEDYKPIGTIGSLYIDFSSFCHAWFGYVYVNSGCYYFQYDTIIETNADNSYDGPYGTVCGGQRLFTDMVGDWQGGGSNGNGCYHMSSKVLINGVYGYTNTDTFCF